MSAPAAVPDGGGAPGAMSEGQELIRVGEQALEFGLFSLRPTELAICGRPTLEEWIACGDVLRRMEGAVQWWWGDWLRYGESREDYGERRSQAFEASGYEESTLAKLKYVCENVPPRVRILEVPFFLHKIVASLPHKEQRVWLAKASTEQWSAAKLRSAIRRKHRQDHYTAGPLPEGKFRVFYADPPWAYDDSGVIAPEGAKEGVDPYGRSERHYPTMDIDELADLPVKDHVEDNAVLFLWVTSPLLDECWRVIDAWGFTYKASMVWDKVLHNYGHYISVRHEFLLICTHGSCTPDEPVPMPDSVVTVRRSEAHSEKPNEFRALIERLYPLGRRLELFGRKRVKGWTVYGNQLSRVLPKAT